MIAAGFRPNPQSCICSAIAPVFWLMRRLIDSMEQPGEVNFLEWDSFPFIYISIYWVWGWDRVGIVISLLFRSSEYCELCVLYTENVNSCTCDEALCILVWDTKREYLPPNWYDVWHFICYPWPVRLIMLPKAIRVERARAHTHTGTTHTLTHTHTLSHMHAHTHRGTIHSLTHKHTFAWMHSIMST